MSRILKSNKILREFTFFLVTLTIIGIPVCYLVNNEYCRLYKGWLIRSYKYVKKLYESLPDEQKKELVDLAIRGKKASEDLAKKTITKILHAAKVKDSEEVALKVVKAGSAVVKHAAQEVEKKLSK